MVNLLDIYVANICIGCFFAYQQLSVIMDAREIMVIINRNLSGTYMFKNLSQSCRNYDFQSFLTLASLIYSFAAGVPAVMWLGLRQFNAKLKLITAVCLYGYSLLVFIPVSVNENRYGKYIFFRFVKNT